MKILRTSILAVLAVAGFLALTPLSEAHSSHHVYWGRHPGWSYYYPWAWSFGFGYYHPYYPTYVWNYYPRPYYGPYGPYPTYFTVAGEIRAEVKPNSARVFVNGDYAGTVDDYDGWWQSLKVAPGKHRIVFRESGYTPYVVDMRIVAGGDYHIKYQMTPGNDAMPDEQLRPPRDSRDQQYDRNRDRDRDQDQDRDRDRPSYRDYRQDRPPDRDQDQNYGRGSDERGSNTETLYLQVEPADATIYIDGNYYGTAAQAQSELRVILQRGSHKIEIVRPGYKGYSNVVEIGPGMDDHLNVTLEPK